MIGDFNEITGNHEKRGGRHHLESSFLSFLLCWKIVECSIFHIKKTHYRGWKKDYP